jgi:hypothetical protein
MGNFIHTSHTDQEIERRESHIKVQEKDGNPTEIYVQVDVDQAYAKEVSTLLDHRACFITHYLLKGEGLLSFYQPIEGLNLSADPQQLELWLLSYDWLNKGTANE